MYQDYKRCTAFKKLKPGLYLGIVVTIAEHACGHVLKRVLNFKAVSISIANISCENEYLRSLQLYEDQGIHGKLKKRVLAILTAYMETRLSKDAQGIYNS